MRKLENVKKRKKSDLEANTAKLSNIKKKKKL